MKENNSLKQFKRDLNTFLSFCETIEEKMICLNGMLNSLCSEYRKVGNKDMLEAKIFCVKERILIYKKGIAHYHKKQKVLNNR